uniref:uncharacterized protein LOC120325663 isoform X2 n=1 Tax=Styela clava TaxID=7725 RepID=UPI00193AA22A|nr:uncharacterized protein LOC120325663 isoform X2 [Styela clava]
MEQIRKERLEDVSTEELIRRFSSTDSFITFALSKYGLRIDQYRVTPVQENNRYDVTNLKRCLIAIWKEREGSRATTEALRRIVDKYFEKQVNPDAAYFDDDDDEMDLLPQGDAQIQQVPTDPSPTTINITNIQGTIGQVLLGNETQGNAKDEGILQIDPDVPVLKPSKSEITPEKTVIDIGDCRLKLSAHSVKEPTKHDIAYKVIPGAPPASQIHASSTLTFDPSYQGRKDVKITLPTWCSTEASVDVGIYCKSEGEWIELDRPILTHEGHLELHYRELSNLTAYISQDRLPDIQFKISCFLFNNADGKFAMGFCLADKAIENVFLHRLKKEGFVSSIKTLEPLTASFEDEIAFNITPGQQMTNTHFNVDEQFLSSYQGHISYCTIDKQALNPVYKISQMRKQEEASAGVQPFCENSYNIAGKEESLGQPGAVGHGRPSDLIEFRGQLNAGVLLKNAEEVEIDNRRYIGDESPRNRPKLTYEQKLERAEERKKKAEAWTGKQPKVAPGGRQVIFHGDVNAGVALLGSRKLKIDNRKMAGKRPEGSQGKEIQKVSEPVQVNEGVEVESQQYVEEPRPNVAALPTGTDCEKIPPGSGPPPEAPPMDPGIPEHDVRQGRREADRDDVRQRRRVADQEDGEGEPLTNQDEDEDPLVKPKKAKYDTVLKCVAVVAVIFMVFIVYSYME